MSKFMVALFGLTLLLAGEANATPVYYSLTLTPTSPYTIGGTGTFELASAPSLTGTSLFSGASLLAFDLNIGGDDFTLADDPAMSIQFLNGAIRNISYSYAFPTVGRVRGDALHLSGVYAFYYDNQLDQSLGAFTASVITPAADATPVPEPMTWSLFAAGLAGLGCFVVRRRRVASCPI